MNLNFRFIHAGPEAGWAQIHFLKKFVPPSGVAQYSPSTVGAPLTLSQPIPLTDGPHASRANTY